MCLSHPVSASHTEQHHRICTVKHVIKYNNKDCVVLLNIYEALPGVLGNRGNGAFISGEQGNKGQILRGTGEQRQYWGTGNIRKQILIFGEQGNKAFYFRGTREQVPPWQGLVYK